MMMIAAGLPKCTGQYLVCKYLLDHPKNAMALNDLGIFMRIEKDYPKAIALFLYAKQINDTSVEIATNLAWAYAYAGDFAKAKNYFNGVLKIFPDYGSALEGLSLIAYQEGDRQTLWNNLNKQLLNNSKAAVVSSEKAGEKDHVRGRDLLSLLVRANIVTGLSDNQRMVDEDVLARTYSVLAHKIIST